jgi:hypothetical protein
MRLLSGFWADLRSRGATVARVDRSLPELAVLTLTSTLAAGIGFADQVTRLLSPMPGAGFVLPALPALIVSGLCGHLIRAKSPGQAPLVSGVQVQPVYRYRQSVRLAAMVLFLPLTGAFLLSLARNRPVLFAGERLLSGHVCSRLDGGPVSRATLEVLDDQEGSLSVPERTDDSGFFIADIARFSRRPARLRVSGGQCAPVTISLAQAVSSAHGCGHTRGARAGSTWFIPCEGLK